MLKGILAILPPELLKILMRIPRGRAAPWPIAIPVSLSASPASRWRPSSR